MPVINSTSQVTEARGWWVQGQPVAHSETLSLNNSSIKHWSKMQLGNQGTLNLILSMCIESLAVTLSVCPCSQSEPENLSVGTEALTEPESLSVCTEAQKWIWESICIHKGTGCEPESLSVCTDALAVNLRVCPCAQRHWLWTWECVHVHRVNLWVCPRTQSEPMSLSVCTEALAATLFCYSSSGIDNVMWSYDCMISIAPLWQRQYKEVIKFLPWTTFICQAVTESLLYELFFERWTKIYSSLDRHQWQTTWVILLNPSMVNQ